MKPRQQYLYYNEGAWLRIDPLWKEAHALMALCEAEQRQARALTSVSRRREWASWRALLYAELGPQTITYNAVGAPCLVNAEGHIGVSHSRHSVGVAYSPHGPAALDIESEERNFTAIQKRYLTPEEQHLSPHPAWPCIAWCAKECLYKLAGRREVELLTEIRLHALRLDNTGTRGEVDGEVDGHHYTLRLNRLAHNPEWAVWYLSE